MTGSGQGGRPILISAIDAAFAIGPEFSVLNMERADAVMINVQELKIVQLLKNHVTGIVKNVGTFVIIHLCEKTLISHSVMQVFARVQLEAYVHSDVVEVIENWKPSPPQFLKGLF